MKISILQNQLKSLIGKDDLRPVMQFVYFNKEKNEFCVTNGHTLVVLKATEDIDSLESMPNECLIPLDAFASKLPKGVSAYNLEVDFSENKTTYTTTILNNVSKIVKTKDDLNFTYPKYELVIPKYDKDDIIFEFGLNMKILNQFSALFKGNEALKFTFESNRKAIKIESINIEHNDSIGLKTAIIMPCKIDDKY